MQGVAEIPEKGNYRLDAARQRQWPVPGQPAARGMRCKLWHYILGFLQLLCVVGHARSQNKKRPTKSQKRKGIGGAE